MSRIRSIHPGLFTDEAFMSATAHARLMIIGIWTEAWDDGVFEWKPLTLKAKIFPVDAVDAASTLAELEGLSFIRKFDVNGKAYGAIRNFRKYQRPKTPNSSNVLPNDLRLFVGLTADASEPIPNHFGNASEKSPQMEDGGCRVEDERVEKAATAAFSAGAESKIDFSEVERRCVQATGWQSTDGFSAIVDLISEGVDLDSRILPMLRTISGELKNQGRPPPDRWAFVLKAMRDPSRRPNNAKEPVETVWISVGSDAWKHLAATKKESYLRTLAKPDSSGRDGIWWPARDFKDMKRPSEHPPKVKEAAA